MCQALVTPGRHVFVAVKLARRGCSTWSRAARSSAKTMARCPSSGVAWRCGGGRDGRVQVRDRRHLGTPRRVAVLPFPRRPPGRRRPGPVPASGPAGHPWIPRPQARPPLHGPPDPAHRCRITHRQAEHPAHRTLRRRRAHRGRSHLGDLSTDGRRLPPRRPTPVLRSSGLWAARIVPVSRRASRVQSRIAPVHHGHRRAEGIRRSADSSSSSRSRMERRPHW